MTTKSAQVAASGRATASSQVSASGQLAASCSYMLLHSNKGGEFSSSVLEEFCRDEGIWQAFTLPASTQQNGISERRIGLIMEVARTSMIHAAAPHFLWSFAVRYAAFSAQPLAPFFSSQDITFDESVCFYRLHLHASNPVPLAPLFLVLVPPLVDPLPPQGLAPSGVSQVDLPLLDEPVEISSDSSGPAEGGDPAAGDTAATRRSPH
ncbi:unnamed protein product [Closterium sp. NIES-54]